MTAPARTGLPGEGGIGPGRRDAAAREQLAAMPSGKTVVTCTAAPGSGGLGRHMQEILDALGRAGQPAVGLSGAQRGSAGSARHVLGVPYLTSFLRALPLPTSVGVRTAAAMIEFDAYAAARLPEAEHLIAFNSQALRQLSAARRARYESVALVSANPHLRLLRRRHELARRAYPLEGSWASRLLERNLAEYAEADRIYVASRYVRESFLEQGVREEVLCDFPLTPHPRYSAVGERVVSERFEVVYVGSLSVHKGVPLLIDAVRALPGLDMTLRLVGGWGTPGMRKFVQRACAADPRIVVSPGDPLPWLRGAGVCVHPAYEDGFAYAPAEALAVGVPVIVSEDTGMKELISPDRDGLVLATGDLGALTEAIEAACRGELWATGSRSHDG
ncbi:MAG TPA: glycosyltransferase family 4 protein [Solirubrobacteraceae bacterium]|jgi:glycosyltransferase involved in cell wall biosynthesis|nr:glycosyltransferase family 4 protein [Solirubrobacteraceae bacterium]